jgi:hypothetical protein
LNLCTTEELEATWNTIITSQTPKETMDNFEMMIPALNVDELARLFSMTKASAPPQAFRPVSTLAKHLLSAEDWAALTSRVEV